MKILAAATIVLVVCSGCASGSGDGGASGSSPSAVDSSVPSACASATVDGSTKDADLQRIATEIYDSLSCDSGISLDEQLAAAAKGAKAAMAKADIRSSAVEAAGGMSLSLTKGTGGCQVMVVDSVDSKSLTCMDL